MTDKAVKSDEKERDVFPEEITNSYSLEYMKDIFENPSKYKEKLEKVKEVK